MTLVVVCGVPGAGKTTVSERIADGLEAELLRTDVLRKELVDDPEYTDEETRMVYDELLARGERALERGDAAVLDGTFHDRRFRERAREVAERAGSDLRVVKVECDPAVARERIRAREDDASDADPAVHETIRETFDPLATEHVAVDNSGSPAATRRQVDEAFGFAATNAGDPEP